MDTLLDINKVDGLKVEFSRFVFTSHSVHQDHT